jgi:hypothetical protein
MILKRAVQSRGSATELFIPMLDKPSRELEKDLIAMHDGLKHLSKKYRARRYVLHQIGADAWPCRHHITCLSARH